MTPEELLMRFTVNQELAKADVVHGYTCPEEHGSKEVLLFPIISDEGVLLCCPIQGCKYTQKFTEDMPLADRSMDWRKLLESKEG